MEKAVPVPVSAAVCVVPSTPLLSSVMVSVPVRAPVVEGVKVTSTVQLEPPASEVPHVWVSLKSLLFGPVIVMPAMVSDPAPVLVSVTVLGTLGWPTIWFPKSRLEGKTTALGGDTRNP